MELISKNELWINYTLAADSGVSQDIIFMVFDEQEKLISEKKEHVEIKAGGKTSGTTIIDVSDASHGLLKISLRADENKETPLIDEFFVYQSNAVITGHALLDNPNSSLIYSTVIIALFLIIATLIIRRIRTYIKPHY